MSNFKCSECGMINIDCGEQGYKTPREIELETLVIELENRLKTLDEEAVIKPYQEPIELDALSLVGAIKSILERKTQECEQIKEKYEALKLENQEGYEIVDELKQEVEELKRKVELMMDCPDCKVDEYKKALEEIEEIINNILNSCLGRNTVGCRPTHNVCGDLINILNIINKAKRRRG